MWSNLLYPFFPHNLHPPFPSSLFSSPPPPPPSISPLPLPPSLRASSPSPPPPQHLSPPSLRASFLSPPSPLHRQYSSPSPTAFPSPSPPPPPPPPPHLSLSPSPSPHHCFSPMTTNRGTQDGNEVNVDTAIVLAPPPPPSPLNSRCPVNPGVLEPASWLRVGA